MAVEIVVPCVMFVCVALTIVGVTRAVTTARTRRALVQSNASPELARAVMVATPADLHGALQWALLVGAVGAGLVVVQFLPYRSNDPIAYGTVLLCASAGLFAYYAVGRRLTPRGAGPPVGAAPAA